MTSMKKKIRYRRFKANVTLKDAKYYQSLIKECLNENETVKKSLYRNYKTIVVYMFKTGSEDEQIKVMKNFFGRNYRGFDRKDSATHVTSERKKGLFIINTENVKKHSDKRSDYEKIRDYHKLMMFEELCHLVEQKGDSLMFPSSANQLFTKYTDYLKTVGLEPDLDFEIIKNLRGHRNHYEVYRMMAQSYPELFFKRWSTVFWDEGEYIQKFNGWKKSLNQNIALARLISDYTYRKILLIILGSHDSYGIERNVVESTLEKCEKALDELHTILETEKPELIVHLRNIDESVYLTPKNFWDYILFLWEKNKLIN
jgi:hypothetical protein